MLILWSNDGAKIFALGMQLLMTTDRIMKMKIYENKVYDDIKGDNDKEFMRFMMMRSYGNKLYDDFPFIRTMR